MKRSLGTALLLALIIMLAGYAVWQAYERRTAQARVARMHEQLEELRGAVRASIRSSIPPALAALETKITAMLTCEDAAVFAGCTSNAGARIRVTSFNRHLERTTHAPLSAVQREHAVGAFHQEFERLRAQPDHVDVELLGPEEITEEIAARYLTQRRELFARVHERLAVFVLAAAADAFTTFAEQVITAGAARLQLTTHALEH